MKKLAIDWASVPEAFRSLPAEARTDLETLLDAHTHEEYFTQQARGIHFAMCGMFIGIIAYFLIDIAGILQLPAELRREAGKDPFPTLLLYFGGFVFWRGTSFLRIAKQAIAAHRKKIETIMEQHRATPHFVPAAAYFMAVPKR